MNMHMICSWCWPYKLGVSIVEDGDSGITMELEMQWDGNPSIILDIKTRLGVALPIQVMYDDCFVLKIQSNVFYFLEWLSFYLAIFTLLCQWEVLKRHSIRNLHQQITIFPLFSLLICPKQILFSVFVSWIWYLLLCKDLYCSDLDSLIGGYLLDLAHPRLIGKLQMMMMMIQWSGWY